MSRNVPPVPLAFSPAMIARLLAGAKTETRRPVKPQPTPVTGVWVKGGTLYNWQFLSPSGMLITLTTNDMDMILAQIADCCKVRPGDSFYINEPVTVCDVGRDGVILSSLRAVGRIPEHLADTEAIALLRYLADGTERVVPIPKRVKQPVGGSRRWRGRVLPYEWARPWRGVVTDVRADRLAGDMTFNDAAALREGIIESRDEYGPRYGWRAGKTVGRTAWGAFAQLWDSLYEDAPEFQWAANPFVYVISFQPETTA